MRSEDGFTLIEVVVAFAIATICGFMLMQLLGVAANLLEQQRVVSARDRISAELGNLLGLPAAIRASADANDSANAALKACVFGPDSGPKCRHLDGDSQYQSFRLYLPDQDKVLSAGEIRNSGAVTGTPSAPIRYNSAGEGCDITESECPISSYPIEVTTDFLPYCPAQFEAAWHGWDDQVTLINGAIEDRLRPLPDCTYARNLRLHLTVRIVNAKSGPARQVQEINTLVDLARVRP